MRNLSSIIIDSYGTKWFGNSGLAAYNENGIPISINQNKTTENVVKIFPNPTNDFLNIETLNNVKISSIEIFNMQGKLVLSERITNDQNKVDVRDLNVGVYIVRIYTDRGIVVNKMIKQ